MPSNAPAVLFDIDGTLVDSNYLHVFAWLRAFAELGLPVESWRVHRRIGKDGGALLGELAEGADDETHAELSRLHSQYYQELSGLLRTLPGTHDLLDAVAARGLQVVLATSAPADELDRLQEVLGRDDVISAITSSEDVEAAKPDPGIVAIALRRAGVDPGDAVFVGDAVWDVEAANRIGVPTIGLLSGGISAAELREAGAALVVRDPEDLADALDRSPIAELVARSASRPVQGT